MRILLGLLLGAIVWLGTGLGALANSRVALVIGNSAYQNATRLPNPANDAAAVAALFRSAGFEVVDLQLDLGGAELRRALRNFGSAAQNADVALVYFAGHGIEVDGSNYLIPVDAHLERDLDVEDEALSLERVLKIIEPARHLRLVILDACRDNPFARNIRRTAASRTIGRGLARVEPNTLNTLIAFAAKAGSTASDGSAGNSPFTAALLKHLIAPGIDLRIAFGRIRDEVLASTASRQEPFVYGSLGGSFVSLVPEIKKADVPPQLPAANPTTDVRADYELAERVGTIEAWDYFLAVHGSGYYANLARAQRAKLAAPVPAAAAPAERPVTIATAPTAPAMPATPTVAPVLAPPELARQLQSELKRVGCDPGATNGRWDDQSRRALEGFNRHAGTRFDIKVASIDALETVRATNARICPLKERPKPVARSARKGGGGNCLSFGGRRICQ